MCEQCSKREPELYPDLGPGSMMDIKIEQTMVTGDATQGIRILQKRKVDYMGPEGIESREETQCVYIGWFDLHPLFHDILAVRERINQHFREQNENPTDS